MDYKSVGISNLVKVYLEKIAGSPNAIYDLFTNCILPYSSNEWSLIFSLYDIKTFNQNRSKLLLYQTLDPSGVPVGE